MAALRARNWRQIAWQTVGLSLAAHAVLLGILYEWRWWDDHKSKDEIAVEAPFDPETGANGAPMEVTMIEPKVLDAFASSDQAEKEQQALVEQKVEEAKKPEEQRDPTGQVVEIAPPAVEQRPDKADFVSEYDSTVAHQTKAPPGEKVGAKDSAQAPPAPVAPQPAVAPQQAQEEHAGGPKSPTVLAMRDPQAATPQGQAGMKGSEQGMEQKAPDGTEAAKGQGGPGDTQTQQPGADGQQAQPTPQTGGDGGDSSNGGKALPKIDELRPSEQQLARVIGAGSSDYLKDIDDGAETLLSSKRWKFSDFFNRMKDSVRDQWHPDEKYSVRDPYGQIYGLKNRFTVLKVSLKSDGSVRDILIEKPSGVDFLDDEAVNAFKLAQPFANPPEGLVDPESHLITFRFGFFFEISGAPTFKIFKAN
jgi:TonB family protein